MMFLWDLVHFLHPQWLKLSLFFLFFCFFALKSEGRKSVAKSFMQKYSNRLGERKTIFVQQKSPSRIRKNQVTPVQDLTADRGEVYH